MKVIDLLRECRNGTKIEIEEHLYFDDGDSSSIVFDGTVGEFGKTRYEQEDISCISLRGNAILIIISRVQ